MFREVLLALFEFDFEKVLVLLQLPDGVLEPEQDRVALFEGLDLHVGNLEVWEGEQGVVALGEILLPNFDQELLEGLDVFLFVLLKLEFEAVQFNFRPL